MRILHWQFTHTHTHHFTGQVTWRIGSLYLWRHHLLLWMVVKMFGSNSDVYGISHFNQDDTCWEAWLVQSTAFSSQRFLYLWWRKWILLLLYVRCWSQNTISGTMWEVMPTAKSPVGRSKSWLVCHQWKRWFWMWSLWNLLHVGGPVRTRHHVSFPSTNWDQRLTISKNWCHVSL